MIECVSKYGNAPKNMGRVHVGLTEMMFYLYLPIKHKRDGYNPNLTLEPRLRPLMTLLEMIPDQEVKGRYVYLTAKRTFVTPENMCNRPGWHCDGFMTDDINYIWYDRAPTQFCVQSFDLSKDDRKSMIEMQEQARDENIVEYEAQHLLRLDETVVHRVTTKPYRGLRTFVKVSISDKEYNLEGNSRNPRCPVHWHNVPRHHGRNMENADE